MSKSTNTIVYFHWKTEIYIYVCEDVTHNLCCQIRADDNSSTCSFTTGKSVTATGACANEIIPKSINRSFVYKAKEGRYVRMWYYNTVIRPYKVRVYNVLYKPFRASYPIRCRVLLDVLQYGNVYRSQTIYYQARCSTELHSKKNNIGFSLNILI